MTAGFLRRDALKLIAFGASSAALLPASAVAAPDVYPSRQITIVNPFPPGGNVDDLARILAPALSKQFHQPVSIINTPGADGMLGREYFLRQPDDGHTLLVDSANFVDLNVLIQHAPFKVDDFWMINLPSRDFTLMATSISNDKIKTVDDVIKMLKKDPASLSIGIERSSSDYVNLVMFIKAAGIDSTKLRLITYDGGNPTRTAVLGGVVDFGLVGGEGFLRLSDQIHPLLAFSAQRQAPFDCPAVPEVNLGGRFDPVAGSLRGFAVATAFKNKYPDRYALIVKIYEAVFKNPQIIESLKKQQIPSTWYGPEDSNAIYLKTYQQMKDHVDLLHGI